MSSRISSYALVCLLALAAPAAAAQFRQDFTTEKVDQAMLQVVGLEHECTVEAGADGLRLQIPGGGMQRGHVGIQMKPWIRGDFEIIASYKLVNLPKPEGGWGAGLGVLVELDSVNDEGLTCERLELPGRGPTLNSTHITSSTFGKRQYQPEQKPAEASSGRLRLSRKAGIVEAAVAEGTGEFRRLRTADMGRDDVKLVRISCYTGQAACPVDVVIKDVEVRAGEFLSPEQSHRTRPSRRLAQFWTLGLLNLGLLAAVAAWYRPRAASRIFARLARHGRRTLTILGFLGVLACSAWNHVEAMYENPLHEDESTCIIKTYFANLAFVRGDFDHPLWADYDGLDGPHVGHTLIAASLTAAGEPLHEPPERSFTWAKLLRPSDHRLLAARVPSTLLGSLVAPMTFLIGVWATGSLTAGLAAGLICAFHPLSLTCNARAMNEGPLMFFSVLAILILQWAVHRVAARGAQAGGTIPREFAVLMVLGPVALALAVNSKLTAVYVAATVFLSVAISAVALLSGHRLRGREVAYWAMYIATFVGLTGIWSVDINPTLYPAPFTRARDMLKMRWSMQGEQREAYSEWALYTMPEKIRATHLQVAKQGIGSFSLLLTGLSVLGLLTLIAAEARRRVWRGRVSPALPVLTWAAILAVGMVPTISLNWDRYFLVLVPPWALITGVGLDTALRGARGAARSWLSREWDFEAAGPSPRPLAGT